MIRKIRLKNWRSHLDSEFEFSEGVNALIGIMGSGKTSVLHAISFALFGNFPQLQTKKIKLEDIVMKKPQKKNKSEIELVFSANGKEYHIKRAIELQKNGAKTSYAEIREGDRLLDVTPQGVTRVVEEILQVDYSLFSKAIYSEQDGLDAFLRLPKGQRIEQIDRMLRLDKFEEVRENAVNLVNKIKQNREGKVKVLTDMEKEDVGRKIYELEKELSGLRMDINRLEAEHKSISREKEHIESNVLAAENREKEIGEIRKSLEGLRAGLKEINESIEQKRGLIGDRGDIEQVFDGLREEISALESALREARSKEKEVNLSVASLKTHAANVEKRVSEMKKDMEDKENILKEFEELQMIFEEEPEKVVDMKREIIEKEKGMFYSLQAQIREVEQHISHLETKKDCPICNTEITEEKKLGLVADKRKRIKNIGDDMLLIEKNISELEEIFASINANFRRYEILKESAKGYYDMKTVIEKEIGGLKYIYESLRSHHMGVPEIEKEIEALENRLKEKRKNEERAYSLVRELKLLKNLEMKRKTYLENVSVLEKEENDLEKWIKDEDVKVLRNLLEEKIAKEREIVTRLSALEEKITYKSDALEELKERQNILNKYKEETKRDERVVGGLNNFVSAVKATQFQLREEFLTTVNHIMESVWPEIYPYGDLESVRLIVDEDYVLQLKEPGGWISVDVVSGGEKSLAVLALRIAFSIAFTPNLKWLILDEPTHNLDLNAIRNFSEILRDRIRQFAHQVFLITHEDSLCEGLTGSVYRLDRNKESNAATVVIGM